MDLLEKQSKVMQTKRNFDEVENLEKYPHRVLRTGPARTARQHPFDEMKHIDLGDLDNRAELIFSWPDRGFFLNTNAKHALPLDKNPDIS